MEHIQRIYKTFLSKYSTDLGAGDSVRKKQAYRDEIKEIDQELLYEVGPDLFYSFKSLKNRSSNLDKSDKFDRALQIIEISFGSVRLGSTAPIYGLNINHLSIPNEQYDILNKEIERNLSGDLKETALGECLKIKKAHIKGAALRAEQLAITQAVSYMPDDNVQFFEHNNEPMAPMENKQWVQDKWNEIRPNFPKINGDSACAREIKRIYEEKFYSSKISTIQIKRFNKPEYNN